MCVCVAGNDTFILITFGLLARASEDGSLTRWNIVWACRSVKIIAKDKTRRATLKLIFFLFYNENKFH